ncbi:hypothetical protein P691DRAFT_777999 [Macrolepiota fuliginosa MF-IS2]|uniref:Uncharacterized protein n=1 Tax=Macrolepiota fuliginosa MF-IS2 TaxID=1400762 RepID=A0A9P5X7I8_9AGAR|nr:hypothetical protein P691DRAFT_777999 [Macrolepiota fuliginosa MF-IS2]
MPSEFFSTARKHIQCTPSTLQYIRRIDIRNLPRSRGGAKGVEILSRGVWPPHSLARRSGRLPHLRTTLPRDHPAAPRLHYFRTGGADGVRRPIAIFEIKRVTYISQNGKRHKALKRVINRLELLKEDSALPFQVVISMFGPRFAVFCTAPELDGVQFQKEDETYRPLIGTNKKPDSAMWNGDITTSEGRERLVRLARRTRAAV